MSEQLVLTVAAGIDAEVALCEMFDGGALAVEERAVGSGAVELIAGFAAGHDLDRVANALAAFGPVERRAVVNDGLDEWRRHAEVIRVGPVVVVPAWLEPPPSRVGELVSISIEPGRAFGIGDHPTTRLALARLVDHVVRGASVLDVGCGTGVLAIAAARLGAGNVVAIDHAADAIEVARANVAVNDVDVDVSTAALTEIEARFDIVVANLGGLVTPIDLCADLLRVALGGVLVVSGLLDDQVAGALATFGTGEVDRMAGWAAIVIRPDRLGSCTG